MGQKFSLVPNGASITDTTYFFAAVYNGAAWVNTGYKFTIAQLQAALLTLNRKVITCTVNDTTIEDVFFATDIVEICCNNQTYLIGVDFTQDTSLHIITGIGGLSFSIGQVILARR